jgi:ribosomal protein uS17
MADETNTEMTDETPEETVPEAEAETPADEPAAEVEAPDADETPAEEPAAEAEAPSEDAPTEDAPAEEPAVEAAAPAVAIPKKKRKRVPRPERRQRSKPAREAGEGRKPITRLEKPEHERGRSQERRGVVVSSEMDKTIVVRVETLKAHRKYKKIIRRSTKFHAHDERNEAKVGDVVRIVETRPLSKTKRWRLAEIVEQAK